MIEKNCTPRTLKCWKPLVILFFYCSSPQFRYETTSLKFLQRHFRGLNQRYSKIITGPATWGRWQNWLWHSISGWNLRQRRMAWLNGVYWCNPSEKEHRQRDKGISADMWPTFWDEKGSCHFAKVVQRWPYTVSCRSELWMEFSWNSGLYSWNKLRKSGCAMFYGAVNHFWWHGWWCEAVRWVTSRKTMETFQWTGLIRHFQ